MKYFKFFLWHKAYRTKQMEAKVNLLVPVEKYDLTTKNWNPDGWKSFVELENFLQYNANISSLLFYLRSAKYSTYLLKKAWAKINQLWLSICNIPISTNYRDQEGSSRILMRNILFPISLGIEYLIPHITHSSRNSKSDSA